MMKTILTAEEIQLIIKRLALQLIETASAENEITIIGLQPRGVLFSDKIIECIKQLSNCTINYGKLDNTFYRDDIRDNLHLATTTSMPFNIDNKKVIIVDDVLFTGRTIRASLDALLAFGRPSKVELCVLIDRKLCREFPIQPDYTGRAIETLTGEKVKVLWQEIDGDHKVIIP